MPKTNPKAEQESELERLLWDLTVLDNRLRPFGLTTMVAVVDAAKEKKA